MDVLGDNFKVFVRASGRNAFEQAMALAFNGSQAKHWAVTKSWGLCYFWFMEEKRLKETTHHHWEIERGGYKAVDKTEDGHTLYIRDNEPAFWTEQYLIKTFPQPRSVGMVLDHAWNWLNDYDTKYPSEPDHDGCNNKGFTIATQEGLWHGHIGEHRGGICFVKPDWMWLGK